MKRLRHPFAAYLVLLFVFGWWAYNQSLETYKSQVAACDRGNVNRQGQLDLANDLVAVNRKRIKAASSPAERRANRYAFNQYSEDRDTLVESQADVATQKGGVQVDCGDIYPKPGLWP